MFARPLFVRMRTNSLCLRLRYSFLCGRRARVCVYAVLTYADEEAVFACTLLVYMLTNSPCLGVRYSWVSGRIYRVCVYAILADAAE